MTHQSVRRSNSSPPSTPIDGENTAGSSRGTGRQSATQHSTENSAGLTSRRSARNDDTEGRGTPLSTDSPGSPQPTRATTTRGGRVIPPRLPLSATPDAAMQALQRQSSTATHATTPTPTMQMESPASPGGRAIPPRLPLLATPDAAMQALQRQSNTQTDSPTTLGGRVIPQRQPLPTVQTREASSSTASTSVAQTRNDQALSSQATPHREPINYSRPRQQGIQSTNPQAAEQGPINFSRPLTREMMASQRDASFVPPHLTGGGDVIPLRDLAQLGGRSGSAPVVPATGSQQTQTLMTPGGRVIPQRQQQPTIASSSNSTATPNTHTAAATQSTDGQSSTHPTQTPVNTQQQPRRTPNERRRAHHSMPGYTMPGQTNATASSSSGQPLPPAMFNPQTVAAQGQNTRPARPSRHAHHSMVGYTMPGQQTTAPQHVVINMPPLAPTGPQRAPGGVESLFAATVPTPRDVNPLFSFSALEKKLPDDVLGCTSYMLSAMRREMTDVPDLEALARKQSATLQSMGITDRAGFVNLLKQAQFPDRMATGFEGLVKASPFNAGQLAVNLKAEDVLLVPLMNALKGAPAGIPGLITGAVSGLFMCVLDATIGPAAKKTFQNAYNTRPTEDKLPEFCRGHNPHTRMSLAKDLSLGLGSTYGAARNGGVRIPATVAYEMQGQPEKRGKVDGYLDPGLGAVMGGIGGETIMKARDEGAGRGAGLQFFLARDDLRDCIQHLQKPAMEQIASGFKRGGDLLKNMALGALPLKDGALAVPDALLAQVSKPALAADGIVAGVIGGMFSMLTTMPKALMGYGLSEKEANIATQMSKYALLQVLYSVALPAGIAWGAIPRQKDPSSQSPV